MKTTSSEQKHLRILRIVALVIAPIIAPIGILIQMLLLSACSTEPSQAFAIVVDPTLQKTATRMVYSIQGRDSAGIRLQLAEGTMHVQESDVLTFARAENAQKRLDELQPYQLAYIMQEKEAALRNFPSLGSPLVRLVPPFSALSVLSLPQGERTVTDSYFFSQNRQLWIQVRHKNSDGFSDGWLLVTQQTKLFYEDESNLLSPLNALRSLQKALFWTRKNAKSEQGFQNLSYNDLKNHALFFDIARSNRPRFTIKENSSEFVIPVSGIWPYSENQFLVPSFHLELTLPSSTRINVRYPDDSSLIYIPISTETFLQETQSQQSYKNEIYKILTRYNSWNSKLHGKIGISDSDLRFMVFIKWFLPLYLSKYFKRTAEGVLDSVINFDFFPGDSIRGFADYVIGINLDSPPKPLFFALQDITPSSFSLQKIAEKSISISSQNIVEGRPEGSAMIFLGINE